MEIGPYTVERQLFTSGISELFLVHEGRRPAIKMVLKRHLTDQDREVYEALLRADCMLSPHRKCRFQSWR